MTHFKITSSILLTSCALLASLPSIAQLAPNAKPAPQETQALEQQYKNCPNGYYNGPRPGRVRYTKDPWMWVVTPAFAQKHCFPAEFISTELKGAEAIAVKIYENPDEIVCGWGDNKEVCRPTQRHWRFELYVPTGTLPKARNVTYFNPADLASRMLFTKSEKERQSSYKYNDANPRMGALGIFTLHQVDFYGIKDSKAVWGLGRMGTQQYYERVTSELDFLALSVLPGELANDKQYQRGMDKFVIAFRKPTVTYAFSDKDYDEAPLKVELPKSLIEKMRKQDAEELSTLKRDAKRALDPKSSEK
jgi:hypothetical protein